MPEPLSADTAVLEAVGLVRHYGRRRGHGQAAGVRAVDGVSLRLEQGKTLALVGESGSGKSTIARVLGQLERPTAGSVLLNGKPVPRRVTRTHHRQVQMIFQDPFASLNPIHTIGYNIIRSLLIHHHCGRGEAGPRAAAILEQVNLSPGSEFLGKLPHQLSGGQRQRAAIAAALAVGPSALLADEPVSMLDVSIRVEILSLLQRLTAEQNLALLYITHDIASARYFADQIVVLYQGRVAERGPATEVVERPAHPYTQLLVAAAPRGGASGRPALPQLPRSAATAPAATERCAFAGRCPHTMPRCTQQRPPEFATGDGRASACWLHADDVSPADHATQSPDGTSASGTRQPDPAGPA